MTDSRRWLESGDASDEALALLRSAAPPHSLGRAARARTRRRVVALGALPAAMSSFFWLQATALGALLGAGTVGVVAWVESLTEPRPASVASASARPAPAKDRRAMTLAASASVAAPVPPPLPAATTRLPARPNTPTERVPERAEAVAAQVAGSDLVREARLLESARALLGHDPARALDALKDHELEFPNGALALERELLSVDALLRLGRRSEASERAAKLRARAPASLYEERLTNLLARGSESVGGVR